MYRVSINTGGGCHDYFWLVLAVSALPLVLTLTVIFLGENINNYADTIYAYDHNAVIS